jgi:hypothetical protein
MVGGAAYYAGKKGSERQQREQEQEYRIQELESQQAAGPAYAAPPPAYAAPPPAAPQGGGGLTPEAMQQLQQLAQLKEQGVLTDEEFDAQKRRILGG